MISKGPFKPQTFLTLCDSRSAKVHWLSQTSICWLQSGPERMWEARTNTPAHILTTTIKCQCNLHTHQSNCDLCVMCFFEYFWPKWIKQIRPHVATWDGLKAKDISMSWTTDFQLPITTCVHARPPPHLVSFPRDIGDPLRAAAVRTWFPAGCCCSRPSCYEGAPNPACWWGAWGQQGWAGCAWSWISSAVSRPREAASWHTCRRAAGEAEEAAVWRWTGCEGYQACLKQQGKDNQTYGGLLF